ncbi:MAG: hypothetical protein BIFFINMI_00693 [Phycisphaerae bacterium]|nr:hypothetical protein [Phycisphaerae bacterium]
MENSTFSQETIALSDGYVSHASVYTPGGSFAGRPVLCFHGIQSHRGWFTNSSTVLARAGHPVIFPDRRGSGGNRRPRGHARSIEQLMDDGRVFMDRAAGLAGDGVGPIHMLGISWGGKWALGLAAAFPDRVASLVLSTPGLFAKRRPGPLSRLGVVASAIAWPRATFAIPLNEPELFTDQPDRKAFIAADPLRLTRATGRMMAVSHLMQKRLAAWAAGVRCPVLLLLAENDPIIDNARTLAVLEENLPAGLLTVKRFESAVHTLEFAADPSGYFQALIEWLGAHNG